VKRPPEAVLAGARKKIVRGLGIAASVLMVLLVGSIFFVIVRTEAAHDDATCAFVALGERRFLDAVVHEETRSCVPEAEEHRWSVQRGAERYELGRKRLPKARFTADRTKWTLSEDPEKKGTLVLRIEVDGAPFSEFREQDAHKN
jgi:hypothetical protein